MPPIRFKGKWIKEKKYNHFLKRQETGQGNKNSYYVDDETRKINNSTQETSVMPVEGNRIIDMQFMASQMFCEKCGGDLLLKDIKEETCQGFGSHFKIECHTCLWVNSCLSSPKYKDPTSGHMVFAVNTKAALGIC